MPANIAPASSPAAGTTTASSRPIQPLHQASSNPTVSSASNGASLTQKQWTVPPRPKPGRKPATDTPATKRKAQNRVAQRAFRERKAAKIGELEEQIEEIAKDHAAEVTALQTQVASMAAQLNQQPAGSTDRLTQSVHDLDGERWRTAYLEERRLRENLERELAILKGEAVSLPRRNLEQSYNTPEDISLGCSKCSVAHCQCLEDALEGSFTGYPPDQSTKRPISPSPLTHLGHKKHRSSKDMTSIDAAELRPDANDGPTTVLDGCGFCTDGSTCLCADLEADKAAKQRLNDHEDSTNLPSPPSEAAAMEIDFTTTTAPRVNSGCPNGPGSCSACQRDPERMLLCKTLAASRDAQHLSSVPSVAAVASHPAPAPCAAGAACCRLSTTLSAATHPAAADAQHGLTISCAEAFNTLQRHPAFGRASQDIGEWLPRLATITAGTAGDAGDANAPDGQKSFAPQSVALASSRAAGTDHTAFEIETASILGVLRFFDRRFGREA